MISMATSQPCYDLYVMEDTGQVDQDDLTATTFVDEFMSRCHVHPQDPNRLLEICLPRQHFMAGYSVFDCHFDAIAKSKRVLCIITPSNGNWIRHCQQSGYFAKIVEDGPHCFIVVFVGFEDRSASMRACPDEFKSKDKLIFNSDWRLDSCNWERLRTSLCLTRSVAPRCPTECSEGPTTSTQAEATGCRSSGQSSVSRSTWEDSSPGFNAVEYTDADLSPSGIVAHPSSQTSSIAESQQVIYDGIVVVAPLSLQDTIDGPVSEDGVARPPSLSQLSVVSSISQETRVDNVEDRRAGINPNVQSGMTQQTRDKPGPLSVSRSGEIFNNPSTRESTWVGTLQPGTQRETQGLDRLNSDVTTDGGPSDVLSSESSSVVGIRRTEPLSVAQNSSEASSLYNRQNIAGLSRDFSHASMSNNLSLETERIDDVTRADESSLTSGKSRSPESGYHTDHHNLEPHPLVDSRRIQRGDVDPTSGSAMVDSPVTMVDINASPPSTPNPGPESGFSEDDMAAMGSYTDVKKDEQMANNPQPARGNFITNFFSSVWQGLSRP